MAKSNTILKLLLRFLGIASLFALVAVFMPLSWMVSIHGWLGLGEMPTAPVVEYLARSVSIFYALFGFLCLLLAADLERYFFSAFLVGIDLLLEMPSSWTIREGIPGVIGVLIFVLAGSKSPRSEQESEGN